MFLQYEIHSILFYTSLKVQISATSLQQRFNYVFEEANYMRKTVVHKCLLNKSLQKYNGNIPRTQNSDVTLHTQMMRKQNGVKEKMMLSDIYVPKRTLIMYK